MKSQEQGLAVLSLVGLGVTESPVVRSILDSMSDSLLVLGQDGGVLYANRITGSILGCSPDDLMEHGLDMLLSLNDKNEDFNQIFIDAVRGKNVNNYSEVDYYPPGGAVRRLAATTSYLMALGEHETSFMGFVVLFKDITEIYNLRREEKELLCEKDRIAKEKIGSLHKLAMGVAREIRNPMATIGEFAAGIHKDERNPEETRRYGHIIIEHAKQLEKVADRVRQCCDLPAMSLTTGSISSAVSEAVSAMVPVGLKNNVILKFSSHMPEEHAVTFDPYWFRVAVEQILENAIGFSTDGSMVDAAIYQTREGTVLEVRDYGTGISDEDKEYIFDPFFSTRNQGTGMGLAIVERVIHKHLGKIEIESDPGRGTTVRITLPYRTPSQLACDTP
ncbi:MAG: ATP-binding protein [Desulfomonilaceae bacterium]